MSAPPAQIPSGEKQRQPKAPQRSRGEMARTGALVVLAVLITLFAVFNLKEVKVDWMLGSGRAPLIVVIVDLPARGHRAHVLRRTAGTQATLTRSRQPGRGRGRRSAPPQRRQAPSMSLFSVRISAAASAPMNGARTT